MTEPNQHRIGHITDTLKLTEDQFGRFIADFAAWWALCKMAEDAGAKTTGFVWVDDEKPGEIHSVVVTDPQSGEETVWEGSAASPSPIAPTPTKEIP